MHSSISFIFLALEDLALNFFWLKLFFILYFIIASSLCWKWWAWFDLLGSLAYSEFLRTCETCSFFSTIFWGISYSCFYLGGNLNDSAVLLNLEEWIWVVFLYNISLPATLPLGFSLMTSSSSIWGEPMLIADVIGSLRGTSFSEMKVWLGFDLSVSGLASEKALRFFVLRD